MRANRAHSGTPNPVIRVSLVFVLSIATLGVVRPSLARAEASAFVIEGDLWTYCKGTMEPPVGWNGLGFDDTGWLSGPTGIGYGGGDEATVLDDMLGNYTSVYMRRSFAVANLSSVVGLTVRVNYDDGFVAYLNGKEIARRNLGGPGTPVPYDATATNSHDALGFETMDVSDHLGDLVMGTNVLAIQVHNFSVWSSDLSMTPELHWVADTQDLSDTLLLYDARDETASDVNFCRISEFYGLKWAAVDLSTDVLSDIHLRDEGGAYYRAIGISESTLALLDSSELALLEDAVDVKGSNLLIADLSASNSPAVENLTDGEITGSYKPDDSTRDFIISNELPQVTREFTGQSLTDLGSYDQVDYAVELGVSYSHIKPIISSADDSSTPHPIFVSYQDGIGSMFVQGRNNRYILDDWSSYYYMRSLYMPKYLTELVPLMMFIRHTAGDKAWSRDRDYANLTIDDAPLVCENHEEPCHWRTLYWSELLTEMQAHDFHTTVGFIPANYQISEPEVTSLFLDNPDRYSLVFHGNNHDSGRPFPDDCPEFAPDIPGAEKENDLAEAKWRMQQHEHMTGIPHGMAMIFPCQLSGLETLGLLKKYNLNATVNGQSLPIDAEFSTAWDRGMYPAYMEYSNFATVERYEVTYNEYQYFTSYWYMFDLFRDRPALVFDHAQLPYRFFETGMDAFNPYADAINGLEGEVEWKSLDYILKRLYLRKRNDDGSVDVRMYGNNLILENRSDQSLMYHVKREEDFSYPLRVLVDGLDTPYSTTEDELAIDLTLPPHSAKEILIIYATITGTVYEDADFSGAFSPGDTPLAGVQINLSDGQRTFTSTTYADGTYLFANIVPGDYAITETDLPDYLSSGDIQEANDNQIVISLPSGAAVTGQDFYDCRSASVRGTVYDDADGDGAFSSGDVPLMGVEVALSNGLTTTTDSNGAYQFAGLTPGSYTITETDLPGYVSVADAQGTNDNLVSFSLVPGDSVVAQDFLDRRSSNDDSGYTVFLPTFLKDTWQTRSLEGIEQTAPGSHVRSVTPHVLTANR